MADQRSAAFFDLDRTVLRGPSGPIISDALRAAGVVTQRELPGERLAYKVYEVVGETLPSMALARQAARVAKGWAVDQARAAAEVAADGLVTITQPFVAPLIAEHREAGRPVVLATTSPYDLVKPLADRLGFDDVVATRYGRRNGAFDGTIDGPFVWGTGKLDAVRKWAAEHGVSVSESWAYSDSVYDIPLLSAVGHAVAVNPDPRLRIVALARRWPVRHLDVPSGVPKLFGIEPFKILSWFARPELVPFARFDIEGTDAIPREGPAIVVANHRSYFDTMAMGLTVARAGRPVRFLGKREVFDAPVIGPAALAMGGIPVDRGTGSEEPLKAAAEALQGGQLVALMPQGTIPRGRAFFDPELRGRWGAARLAALSKAPVIPVGMWGTELVWPRSAKVPNVLNVTSPPLIRVRVGDPVDVKHRSLDADTKRIMQAIMALLPEEARAPRQPTDDELRRSVPSGRLEDAVAEDVGRRPGRD